MEKKMHNRLPVTHKKKRPLKTIFMYFFYGKCPFQSIIEIYSDSVWAKLRSVETFRCQDVT